MLAVQPIIPVKIAEETAVESCDVDTPSNGFEGSKSRTELDTPATALPEASVTPTTDDTTTNYIIEKLKWLERLVIYAPLWSTKLANKKRSTRVNIFGISCTMVLYCVVLILFIERGVSSLTGFNNLKVIIQQISFISQLFMKLYIFWYFNYCFDFNWYKMVMNDIVKQKITSTNKRLIIYSLLWVISWIATIILVGISGGIIKAIILLLYTGYMALSILIQQMCVSLKLLEYEIYLVTINKNICNIIDVKSFCDKHIEIFKNMESYVKKLQWYFVPYFVIVIVDAWILVSKNYLIFAGQLKVDPLIFAASLVEVIPLLIPIFEFAWSTAKIGIAFEKCLENNHLSNNEMRSIYLILQKYPVIVKLLGIECTKKKFIGLALSFVLTKSLAILFSNPNY